MIDLKDYKLTLPCNSAGGLSGKAHEIYIPEDYRGPWFSFSDDGYLFTCPDGGATTKTAKYPRSELRDQREFSFEESSSDKLKFRVLTCPINHKIVVHQIHDENEPWVKIVWHQKEDGGSLYALVKQSDGSQDTRIDFLEGIKFRKPIISLLSYENNNSGQGKQLIIKINKTIHNIQTNRNGSGGKAYFKRGAYFQSNERNGKVCVVEHINS